MTGSSRKRRHPLARAIPSSRFVGFRAWAMTARALWPEFVAEIAAFTGLGERDYDLQAQGAG